MNAMKDYISVNTAVSILMVPTPAHVTLAIHLPSMDLAAQVSLQLFSSKSVATLLLHIASDVDECAAGSDMCAQNCQDTVGSYTCSCRAGYSLNADGRTCRGLEKCLLLTMCRLLMHLHMYCRH